MPRFLIEVPHDPTTLDCVHAVDVFLRTGSHFLRNADWGCRDGVHKAIMLIELDDKHEALNIVPSEFRGVAHVTALNNFTREDIDQVQREHGMRA